MISLNIIFYLRGFLLFLISLLKILRYIHENEEIGLIHPFFDKIIKNYR